MFERLVATLRALVDGVSRPTASSCSGDPIAWEKDWARRRGEERGDRSAMPDARAPRRPAAESTAAPQR